MPPSRKRRAKGGKRTATTKAAASDSVDLLIAASAYALALPIDADWLGPIKFNLQLILRHAALVAEFSLPDDAEPAPVFRA
jgi:hypothetical protein